MARIRKSQDEKDLEKLAKKLLSMPHKPREAWRWAWLVLIFSVPLAFAVALIRVALGV